MFFENSQQIPQIARHTECSIFVISPDAKISPDIKSSPIIKNSASAELKLPRAIYLRPDEDKKTAVITVEQVRDFCALTTSRETMDRFFVISPADAMNEAAQNAFLKTLEEPHTFCHFILLTAEPNLLLPTIRSRAQIFYPRATNTLDQAPQYSEKTLRLAKQLISATPTQLINLANDLTKSKTNTRETVLETVSAAIELLYKSYFKTGNQKFLTKLAGFLQLHASLSENGHIKLHLVADLI